MKIKKMIYLSINLNHQEENLSLRVETEKVAHDCCYLCVQAVKQT